MVNVYVNGVKIGTDYSISAVIKRDQFERDRAKVHFKKTTPPPTIGDQLRKMNDKELGEFIALWAIAYGDMVLKIFHEVFNIPLIQIRENEKYVKLVSDTMALPCEGEEHG